MQKIQSLIKEDLSKTINLISPIPELEDIVSHIAKRDTDPLSTAKAKAVAFNIPNESREADSIIKNLMCLHTTISSRWNAYKQYMEWQNETAQSTPPTFTDNTSGATVLAEYALAPCNLVNTVLNEFVGLTLKIYSPEKLQDLIEKVNRCPKTTTAIQDLRNVAIHAEEAMEREALNLIFKAISKHSSSYKESIKNIVQTKYHLNISDNKPKSSEIKMALLEALVVDFPSQLKNIYPNDYPEMVFPYFKNYAPLVQSELELLKVPFLLQNLSDEHSCKHCKSLIDNNLKLYEVLKQMYTKCSDQQMPTTEIKQLVTNYPEIFGVQELSKKVFTFVGAGFPLTGIILHILTGGALINLIDYNKRVVEDIRKLICITDSLGITRKNAIQIIHADALEIEYLPTQHTNSPGHMQQNSNRLLLYTDILDLASALPAKTTKKILENNAKTLNIIRKRNVGGASEFLYEKFINNSDNNFCLIGEAAPPQQVLSRSSDHRLVTCVSDPQNVNSSGLYINTSKLQSKFIQFQSDIYNSKSI